MFLNRSAGMFKIFNKLKQKKQIKDSIDDFMNLWETDFDDIWSIDIKSNLLVALNGWICKKSNYGENFEILSQAEKVFYLVFQLEGEVDNGGFSQFFYNSSGDFSNETPAALREIGANKTAAICDKALFPFGGALPQNRDEREAVLDNLLTDEINEILNQCDSAFYEEPDDLSELNYPVCRKTPCFSYGDIRHFHRIYASN